jgi:predicted transcriptional regulator
MMNDEINAVELAAELTAAWLANPNTRTNADDVPAFLVSMHTAVLQLSGGSAPVEPEEPATTYEPAVTARKSLANPDVIISMIDGKPYKTLRRHLAGYGMTPEEYRARYNLKTDYPMVAPSYSEARRDMAKRIGLGRKPGQTNAERASQAAPEPEQAAPEPAKATKAARKPRAAKVTEEA